MTKTNSGLAAYAKAQVGNPYWYGTFGNTASASLYASKQKQYPTYYTATDYESQYGERVHDCAGLVKGYVWSASATSAPVYNAAQDYSAKQLYAKAETKGKIATFPKTAGLLLFKGSAASSINHVGVYGGDGYVYEAKGHAYGVVKTAYKASDWTFWAQCSLVEDDTTETTTATTSSVSAASTATTSSSCPTYYVGKVYTTRVSALNVRTGPGISYSKKAKSQLTANAQANANSSGQLNKGTSVTCKELQDDSDGNRWMRIPSGWVAAWYGGKVYVG